jgi:hypothetical protein
MGPYADVTLPVYKLDPQYYLSNLVTPNQSNMLRTVFGAETTLTAGWVSETARGGETIIHRVNPTAVTEWWFGNHHNDRMTVDAPELTISRSTTSNSRHIQIFGRTVEVHDIIERSGSGSSCSVKIRTGETFKANSVASPGYIYMYSPYYNTPATQGINRDIKHITTAYQLYIYEQGHAPAVNLKFKNLSCYYLSVYATTAFSYYDDFFFFKRMVASQTPTEMAIDPAVNPATVFPLKGPMSTLAPKLSYNDNSSYRNYNYKPIKTFGGYLAKGAEVNTSRGDVYFRDLLLPVGGTLENTTSHSVKSSQSSTWYSFHGKSWGVDRNSGRRVAFGTTQGEQRAMMMMYNSTEYNNKLVYHLMPNANYGRCYDRVYIDMPTGVSEIADSTNLRIKYTLGGAVSTGVTLSLQLEGNTTCSTWGATGVYNTFIQPSDGGEGTVIYSGTFNSATSASTSSIAGAQQLLGVLELAHQEQNPTGVAKICIDSIELEVV